MYKSETFKVVTLGTQDELTTDNKCLPRLEIRMLSPTNGLEKTE